MKKFFITCLYLSLTVAVCTAGFLLPSMLNDYQDRLIFAKIEHTAIEPPELTYSSSLFDTLRLLSKDHYFVEYPSAGSSRTGEEIYAAACGLLKQLTEYGVLSPDSAYDITNYTTALQLAIVSDSTQPSDSSTDHTLPSAVDAQKAKKDHSGKSAADITTAVVWSCGIYFNSGYWINIWFDDKSGKAVAGSMFTEQAQILTSSGSQELDVYADAVAAFAEHYYELPAAALKQSFVHAYNTLFEKKDSIIEAYYTIQLKEESGTSIELPLKIRPECIIIN